MVRGFYSTEEVFRGGLRAALNGGWGGAEICFIFHIYGPLVSGYFLLGVRVSDAVVFTYSNARAKVG